MRLLAQELACIRGGRRLFQGLSFQVAAGEALLVTGPNGAGKTSLLRMIAGLLRPAAGRVAFDGIDADREVGIAAHFVGHLDAVKGSLSAEENLYFVCDLLGGAGDAVAGGLARFGLAPLASFPARMLSAGQRRRLALARLLVASRPLWLLDEPTTGLDNEGQEIFAALTATHLANGGLLVAATHTLLPHLRAQEIRLASGGGA
ncbi:MAG TPA: heme ABC exporter ATP-binding protein CcmA [Xanthobacteraceae bacterium]|jgi:heme exporter protein A